MGAIAEALGLASALFSALPPVARRVGPRACLQALRTRVLAHLQ